MTATRPPNRAAKPSRVAQLVYASRRRDGSAISALAQPVGRRVIAQCTGGVGRHDWIVATGKHAPCGMRVTTLGNPRLNRER